jgi:hypothetical protein
LGLTPAASGRVAMSPGIRWIGQDKGMPFRERAISARVDMRRFHPARARIR